MTKQECLDYMRLMLDEYEARAIKAENQLQAILHIQYGPPMPTGGKTIATFCGVEIDEAARRVCNYPEMNMQVEILKRALSHMLFAYKHKNSPSTVDYGEDGIDTYRYTMEGEYISKIEIDEDGEPLTILEIFYED